MTGQLTLRAALAAASLAFTFALAPAIVAAQNLEAQPSTAATPQERESQDATKKDRANCKKVYRLVHRGPPGKGTEQRELVRVECPTPLA